MSVDKEEPSFPPTSERIMEELDEVTFVKEVFTINNVDQPSEAAINDAVVKLTFAITELLIVREDDE